MLEHDANASQRANDPIEVFPCAKRSKNLAQNSSKICRFCGRKEKANQNIYVVPTQIK